MTIYEDIAASILPILPDFSVDGVLTWTVIRPSGEEGARVLTVHGIVTAYIMRNKVDAARLALPQTTVYTAPWLLFGALDQDIQVEDTLVGDGRVFVVVGQVETDFAMLFAPLATATNPLLPGVLRRLRQGAQLGLGQGL